MMCPFTFYTRAVPSNSLTARVIWAQSKVKYDRVLLLVEHDDLEPADSFRECNVLSTLHRRSERQLACAFRLITDAGISKLLVRLLQNTLLVNLDNFSGRIRQDI